MSDVVPHKQAQVRKGLLRNFSRDPEKIIFSTDQSPKIVFADGSQGRATCLGCHDAPCIEFTEKQLNLEGALGEIPGDPSHDVCPIDAINWDTAREFPAIDAERCIGCGICAVNCPYGAINLTPDGVAGVETSDPDGITNEKQDGDTTYIELPRAGNLASATYPFARNMPEFVDRLSDVQTIRLTRNMFAACGVSASMRRKGDTNIRMDGLLHLSGDQIGVVELETSAAVLESPRALIEDVAVLNNRFNVPIENIVPVSIVGTLPNERAEYYRVIDDIEKVLNIRCRTLTLGALCMLMWWFESPKNLEYNMFVTRAGATDLYQSLKQIISDLPNAEPYPGAYRPPK